MREFWPIAIISLWFGKPCVLVFFVVVFFLRLFFGFQRIDFCDIQPILLDVFEYILDHCSTHFFGSVSFTPRCIAFQSCVVKCSHWCQYFSPSSESLTSFSPTNCGFNIWRVNFMAIFTFRSNIFVGRMVKKKKKAKIPNFLQRGNSWRPNNVKTSFVSQVLLLKKWNTFNYFSYKENNFSMVFQITHFFTGIDLIVRFFFSSWFRLKGVVSNRNMMRRKMLDFYVLIKTALRDESRQKRECFATKRGK